MSCNKSAGEGQGYNIVCGDRVYGENSPIVMCDGCKDNLIKKLSKDVDMDILSKEEYKFISQLVTTK